MILREFLHMGGYAAYVWSAFAVTAAVLLLNVILARRHHRNAAEHARRRNRNLS